MSSGETVEASSTPPLLYTPLSLSNFLENLDREQPHVTEDDEPGTGAIPIVNPRVRERQIDNLSAQAPQKKDSNAEGSHCTTEKSDVAQRIPMVDIVRAILICLLVIHAAIIEVISSNAERLGNIRATHPRLIMFASFFIAFHKACVIPLLFFISGISSYIAMASQYRNAPKFIIKKCVVGVWFGVTILVLAQLVRWTFFRNSPPNSRFYFLNKFVAVDESYYATENGKMEMIYGLLRYMTVLTIIDCVYAVARECNRYRTVTRRFSDSKKALTMVGVILLFFQLVQFVFIPPHAMPKNPSLLLRAVHLITNFQNDSFPFICVLAYVMGINITTVGSFYQSKNSVISVWHSIMGLVWRVGFLVTVLYMLYFHLFPSHFPNIFLDPLGKVNFDRNIQPRVYRHNSSTNIRAAAVSHVLWSMTAFGILFDLIAPLILYQVQSAQPSSTDFSFSPPQRLGLLNTLLTHPKWFTAMYFSSLYTATQIWLGVLNINHHHLVTSIVLLSITGAWLTESLGTGFLLAWCGLNCCNRNSLERDEERRD